MSRPQPLIMHPTPANHPCPDCGRATSQWNPPRISGVLVIIRRRRSLYTPLQSGVIFLALSLVPLNIFRYIGLRVAAVSGVIYTAYYRHPSMRIGRLDNMLSATTDILARAKSHCIRDRSNLADNERRLLRIQSRLLEARDAPWKLYFQTIREIWLTLNKCERQVREIRTSTLLTIEAEHQRKLAEHINEIAVVHSPRHNTWSNQSTRAFELTQEPYRRWLFGQHPITFFAIAYSAFL
ncbi:hypothetical protein DFH09DRAFT_1091620 [Mycena vulgaris]|nr:hypothetical protein DFH09DRAFT_1091620 [Mycena vulgaris]